MGTEREERIRARGRALMEGMDTRGPSVFGRDFWQGKMMDWSMRDESFKVEMFRFVDVFPVLRDSEAVARHVQEYFCRPGQDFPAWIQLGLKSVQPGSLVARTAASQIEKNIRAMASTFVAGEDARAALPVLERIRRKGRLAFTVDLLGEATVSEAEAEAYARRYAELIGTLSEAAAGWREDALLDRDDRGPIPRVNVSLKVTSLYSQIDPVDPEGSIAALKRRLMPLYEEARARGVFLNIDMESHAVKDLTLALFRSLLEEPSLRDYAHAGIVLQAYLRDAEEDAQSLVRWCRAREREVTVRLVKGAYWDYETIHAQQQGWPIPVHQEKWMSDASFERVSRLLLEGGPHVRLALGSHNVRSIAAAMVDAEELGVARAALEFQALFGMADPLKRALVEDGRRVREYVPVGELVPGMAYLVRRLLENTSNEGFLRQKFAEGADAEALLADPAAGRDGGADPVVETAFANCPHRDFSRAAAREGFRMALEAVRNQLGLHYPLGIDGALRDTPRRLESRNPAREEELVGTSACADVGDAEDAVRGAWAAFPGWRDTPVAERAALLRRVADRLEERRDVLSAWMVLEVGKSWREADADTAEAIDFCRYYAGEAERWMAPERLGRHPGELNQLFRRPLGVGVVIAPWNFPLAILTGMTMAAVVTGNCVVVKPAEQSPVIAAQLMQVLVEAGCPAGVVQYLPGVGEEVGAHLVAHPRTRFVAFTGSREVGLSILLQANTIVPGQLGPKRVICEMGGKNAIIVDDDADLDEAVAAVVHSAFGFAGQKCSACSRVIVLEGAREAFVPRLVEAVRSLEIGPPEEPGYAHGPVIDAEAAAKVRRYLEIGREEGRLLVEREVPDGGSFVPYAVFDGIRSEHRLAREEIFGPVLAVMDARSFDEALEIANGTAFALTGGVISRSPVNIEKARHGFEVGNLYINRGCTGALVYRQPFGGFRFSGLGIKAGGPGYLAQFVEERAISELTLRRGFAPED
ncbi:MAG: L-glutamate gamma-semialdehyde dehydrogenase [Deltaproteobacteria bacterium]|nr:MAG: L-glutamate gamma-semialdehyde dehydrogenase [Deltaproteobacteria bacterium]